ncbi:MAG: zf-TFIIB domain-containing protein [Sphingorhabdus sp.]
MSCRVCKTGLTMSDRQGVEIDFSSTCRDLWFDREELDKNVERSINDVAPTRREAEPQSYSQRQHGCNTEDHYRHRKRKKSVLSELFD